MKVHDELRGSNIVISCDEKFEDIQSFRVGVWKEVFLWQKTLNTGGRI